MARGDNFICLKIKNRIATTKWMIAKVSLIHQSLAGLG
jgi:hypothetical protein